MINILLFPSAVQMNFHRIHPLSTGLSLRRSLTLKSYIHATTMPLIIVVSLSTWGKKFKATMFRHFKQLGSLVLHNAMDVFWT